MSVTFSKELQLFMIYFVFILFNDFVPARITGLLTGPSILTNTVSLTAISIRVVTIITTEIRKKALKKIVNYVINFPL